MPLPRFITDFKHIVYGDSWAWCVIWGEPRLGKSSLALQIAWQIYHDEDDVLGCFVWSLADLVYKIKNGLPKRFPTANGLHNRVPLLVYDDFGSTGNKASTKSDPSWDAFKSSFDSLGVKLAILVGTMQSATNPTSQLQEKFSHELWIPARGYWKYDRVRTHQNYKGWQPFVNKEWLDQGTFEKVPDDLFLRYDEMRVSLASEMLQRVEDSMVDTHLASVLKRINATDLNLLMSIKAQGPMYHGKIEEELGEGGKMALTRCKARQLVVMRRYGDHYYKADLSDLGLEVLREATSIEPKVSHKEIVSNS